MNKNEINKRNVWNDLERNKTVFEFIWVFSFFDTICHKFHFNWKLVNWLNFKRNRGSFGFVSFENCCLYPYFVAIGWVGGEGAERALSLFYLRMEMTHGISKSCNNNKANERQNEAFKRLNLTAIKFIWNKSKCSFKPKDILIKS